MSTNSTIWVQKEDHLEGIFCYWDGYISNNGKILYENYRDEESLQKLIDRGHIESLRETLEETKFYAKEDLLNIPPFKDHFAKDIEETKTFAKDFNYIFKDGRWFYYLGYLYRDIKPLTPALI
jgi:hypothetical protein